MSKNFQRRAAMLLYLVPLALGADSEWIGVLKSSGCLKVAEKDLPACVAADLPRQNVQPLLVVGQEIFELRDAASAASFAGQRVQVRGQLMNRTIVVRNLSKPPAANVAAPASGFRRFESEKPKGEAGGRASIAPAIRPPAYANAGGMTHGSPSHGGSAAYRANDGYLAELRTPGMTITHGPGGSRIVAVRPDRSVVVANRAGHGYVQRPFRYGGREFVARLYYTAAGGRASYYRPYVFQGQVLYAYVPTSYYPAAFYGWAYRPWPAPVRYAWPWRDSPWFAYYGFYFQPSPVYTTPSLWLTDYLLAATLSESYQEQPRPVATAIAGQTFADAKAIGPELKQSIATEIQREISGEYAESTAAGGNTLSEVASVARVTDGKPQFFVVSSPLAVETRSGGTPCTLSAGDVLVRAEQTSLNGIPIGLNVLASAQSDCHAGAVVSVPWADLQETYNHMRLTVDAGLAELRTQQGRLGLPSLPAALLSPAVTVPLAGNAPLDPNVAAELKQQVAEADNGEKATSGEKPVQAVTPASPARALVVGQTPDEVIKVLGQPQQIVKIGERSIYTYKDMKLTFRSGRLADVQ